MTRGRGRRDAGFLLAETLITFALSALVLVGLASSTAVLLRATDRSVAVVDTADDLGRTLAGLRRDVSGLKRARWGGEEPQGFVFRGGPNSLFFAQERPTADGGRELQVVSLREIVAGRGTALMRAEAHLPAQAADWADLHFGTPRLVPTGSARLRFHYVAEPEVGGLASRPVDTWPSGATLPAAVIVEAVDAASTRLLVGDRIAVRADGDIGCSDRTVRAASGPTGARPSPAGAPTTPGNAPVNINENGGVANKNEFCGRADKGLPPKSSTANNGAPLPGAKP